MSTTKPFSWSTPPFFFRCLVAVISVTAALILAWLLEHYWGSTPFVSLFFCAIIFSAWFGGFRVGLLAVVLSVLMFDYFFLPPIHSFAVNSPEMPRLLLYVVSALLVALLSAAQRSATESLRQARDHLAAKVRELERVIAERDRVQDALQKTQANLAHITRMTTMGELTASIAHEINQPLTAVVNNANACLGLLPDGSVDLQEVRQALTEIVDDANRASAIIGRIRESAKKAPFEKTSLDLNGIVTDVLALARYESVSRQTTIRVELARDLPLISGDRVQLQQVLLNLVMNGMDAMNTVEQSKRVLAIFGRRDVRDGSPVVLLSIQDAGTGFNPEDMARLFEAFYTTKTHGMGMGLAISRSIIEAHGGRLWAELNAGPGATFLFTLPCASNPGNS
jgi:C4-dicarboxylate-specific signal transduction histidine kinase